MTKFIKSFANALKVGEILTSLLPESILASKVFPNIVIKNDKLEDKYYFIEAYQNGRKQGIAICMINVCINFYVCNNRRSDEIGYYKGHWSLQGISNDAYENGFSGFDTVEECAKAIASEMKAMLKI